jgi:hypothetical protein
MRKFKCPVDGCGREAEYEAAIGEEVPIPNGEALTRYPKLGVVQRNHWVVCPIHGRRWLVEQGHHVSGQLPPKN